MEGTTVRLGFCPTRRDVFSKEEALKHKKIILDNIRKYENIDVVDIEDINEEGLLFDYSDLFSIINKMKTNKIDCLFFPHVNFGTEDLVAEVAKALKVPVLIWGPRDDSPLENGLRTRDTQCGMFATGKVLRRYGVPFTYLVNSTLFSENFKNGFKKFLSVANIVKQFKKTRILQISTRPTGFNSVTTNEGELLEKFGIRIYPVALNEITSLIPEIIKNNSSKFIKEVKFVKENISKDTDIDNIKKMIGLKFAIREMADKYFCNAAAIQCWNSLQDVIGIMPCLANSLLGDEGFPCVCETDICGAITAIILQAAAFDEKPIFFADITVRDSKRDNVELFWHCGPFPFSLARNKEKAKAGNHWVLESKSYGTCEWEIEHGDVTIARFDGDNGEYSLFMGEGKGVDGPFTRGTYLWVEVGNWPKWEKKLVEGPYIHHVAGIHGKYADVLHEACKYINFLCPDPCEPDEEEIINRWL